MLVEVQLTVPVTPLKDVARQFWYVLGALPASARSSNGIVLEQPLNFGCHPGQSQALTKAHRRVGSRTRARNVQRACHTRRTVHNYSQTLYRRDHYKAASGPI